MILEFTGRPCVPCAAVDQMWSLADCGAGRRSMKATDRERKRVRERAREVPSNHLFHLAVVRVCTRVPWLMASLCWWRWQLESYWVEVKGGVWGRSVYGKPENIFLPHCSPGPQSVAPLQLKPLSLFVPSTTACGIPWQQIWLCCHMGEISQTKTSIECSLYSPIPAVAAPNTQTPPHPN